MSKKQEIIRDMANIINDRRMSLNWERIKNRRYRNIQQLITHKQIEARLEFGGE